MVSLLFHKLTSISIFFIELTTQEHSIDPDGRFTSEKSIKGEYDAINTFYCETSSGKIVSYFWTI